MRFFVTFAVLAAGLVFSPLTHADDSELFSEVAMEFVYAAGDQSKNTAASTNENKALPTRVTGSSTLMTLLKAAGYEPTKVDSRRASVKMRTADWNLQANFNSDVAADRLTIDMPLAKIADEAKVDQAKLLRLLAVGKSETQVFFAYNKDDGMIELRRVMTNRRLTAERIKQELDDMTRVAGANEDAWSTLEKTAKTSASTASKPPSAPPAPQSKNTAPRPKLSLVGTWSAALGAGEAFAIQINRDATFKLVHFKSGKNVSSLGKAARKDNQLTLNGNDGTKIVGTVSQLTTDAFQLSMSGATLKFKKAK